jgi:hypothetical protein
MLMYLLLLAWMRSVSLIFDIRMFRVELTTTPDSYIRTVGIHGVHGSFLDRLLISKLDDLCLQLRCGVRDF